MAVAVLLFGVALIAYPYVSDWAHKRVQATVVTEQQQAVSGESTDALDAERTKAIDYNRRLLEGRIRVTDPFDSTVPIVSNEEYSSLLDLTGDGVMATLCIPKIGVAVPIYHGTSDDVLQKGAGHLEGTSLPVGGESTHAVLAGHNGLPSVKIFDQIGSLKPGDWFVIQVLGQDLAYRVTGIETVLPDQTESLEVQRGHDLVTLVTCTPYGVNTHRLLVHSERMEVPMEWSNRGTAPLASVPTGVADTPVLPLTLVGVAVGLGVVASRALAARARQRSVSARVEDASARPSRSSRLTSTSRTPSGLVSPLDARRASAKSGFHLAPHRIARPASPAHYGAQGGKNSMHGRGAHFRGRGEHRG